MRPDAPRSSLDDVRGENTEGDGFLCGTGGLENPTVGKGGVGRVVVVVLVVGVFKVTVGDASSVILFGGFGDVKDFGGFFGCSFRGSPEFSKKKSYSQMRLCVRRVANVASLNCICNTLQYIGGGRKIFGANTIAKLDASILLMADFL